MITQPYMPTAENRRTASLAVHLTEEEESVFLQFLERATGCKRKSDVRGSFL